jgi:P27 family predicted phage terminase small subunit
MARITKITDAQKKLQGHSRFVKNVPDVKPITKMWPVPDDLGEVGKRLWEEQGPLLVKGKVLTDLDRPLFVLLCRSLDLVDLADETLSTEGITIDSKGTVKGHPAIKLRSDGMAHVLALSARFGLTPYDRGKIDLKVDSEPNDKMRKFLFGGK